MDTEKKIIQKVLASNNGQILLKIIIDEPVKRHSGKVANDSEYARKQGNELYSQKDRDAETRMQIFNYYCQSILSAPLDSELLALAYGNRSAFLLHMNKYEDCMNDIERALNITKSDALRVKLLCRKVDCMKKLALPNYNEVLQCAENLSCGIVEEKNKTQLNALIRKVKECSIGKVPKTRSKPSDCLPTKNDQTLDCISIMYNEQYGRHLIAKKNYNPGDFIFHDNLYASVLNERLKYTNCNYCLNICWSGIACDHCNWAMFCSADCRQKACNTFHQVECSILPVIRLSRLYYMDAIRIGLRILLLGISETESIEKLRESLILVDQTKDDCRRGFYNNDQFISNTIQSIYSLKSRDISKVNSELLALNAMITVMTMVKSGELIKSIKLEQIDDVKKNDDLMFLGWLLMKLTLITINNQYSMVCDCRRFKRSDFKCCNRGIAISALSSLLNHSCNPNAARVFTDDRQIKIFAVQPIKKDSQIFVTYAAFYYDKLPEERKKLLNEYNFTCQCQACVEFWPPLFRMPNYYDLVAAQSVFAKRLYNDCKYIFDALDVKKVDFSKKDVDKLRKVIVEANKRLTEPSILMATVVDSLVIVYSRIYGWKTPVHEFNNM